MLEFEQNNIIFTGLEERTSKKTGDKYKIVNFLDLGGQTFGCMLEGKVPEDLKQLDLVNVTFKVIPGRYTQLKVLSIEKV